MRKMLCVFTCLLLLVGLQASAKVVAIPSVGTDYGSTDNPRLPKAPERVINNTDDIIYYEDFEAGYSDWELIDLTDVSSWHTSSYNAYGSSGMSWWAGDEDLVGYENHWLQYLDSPEIDLTGATSPTLEFDLFYAVEEPAVYGAYDGWDGCNVWVSTDGGANWDVLDIDAPAYNCTSLYSFGGEWGMGVGIPGWGGFSGGSSPGAWVAASDALSAYAGQTIKLRFAFASDPVWCTGDDPLLICMFVDNVLVSEGATTYLENDAEGTAYPSDLVPTPGMPPTGNYWFWSSPTFPVPPSGTHVMECSDGAGSYDPNIFNALVSPEIDLTGYTTGSALGDFYLRGTINVNDPDPFPDLDNYTIQVQPQGGAYGWYYYSNPWGTPGGDNYVMTTLPADYQLWSEYNGEALDLTEYLGYVVKVRILFQSDPDNYFGEGLFIDDFTVEYTQALDNDVSCEMMHVPMPTSLYFANIPCSVEIHNWGINNQGQIPTFWRQNYGTPNPFIPWPAVNSGQYVTREWDWTPGATGSYFMDSYTLLMSPPDENTANDTSKAGLVVVTDANTLEFGYDNRQYSYEPSYFYFNFVAGEGAYVRYTPQADGVTDPVSIQSLKALFNDTGTIRVHIYEEGTATAPGDEVVAFNTSVTVIDPNWQTIDVSSVSYLQNLTGEFWVWYEVLNAAGTPHIMGWDQIVHGEGHFFADFGSGFGPSDYDFFARAIGTPGSAPNMPLEITYTYGSPVPASGGELHFSVYLENASGVSQDFDAWIDIEYEGGAPTTVVLRNFTNYLPGWAVNRPDVYFPVPGAWAAGNYELIGRLGEHPNTIWNEDGFAWVKSGVSDGSDFQPWVPDGVMDPFDQIDKGMADLPAEYQLLGSYPNPFNPTSNISFALPEAGLVQLKVYDMNGRLVATLADGQRAAGVHDVTFDATGLASGVYVYQLTAGDFSGIGKMLLLK